MAEQEYDGIYSDLTEKIISAAIDVHRELGCGLKEEAYEAYQCRTYLYMMNLPAGLVLNFGFPTLKEGLEHVDNFKASNPPNLPDSHTPSSESNLGSLTPKTPPNLPASSSPGSESNPSTSTPSLPHSSPPNSESNPTTSTP